MKQTKKASHDFSFGSHHFCISCSERENCGCTAKRPGLQLDINGIQDTHPNTRTHVYRLHNQVLAIIVFETLKRSRCSISLGFTITIIVTVWEFIIYDNKFAPDSQLVSVFFWCRPLYICSVWRDCQLFSNTPTMPFALHAHLGEITFEPADICHPTMESNL